MKKILLSVFVLSILLPTLAFASFDTSLKYGSRGSAVTALQDFLQNQGFLKTNVDGRFGLATLSAVKAFQSANGLPVDGYFGKASRAKANSILATILQPSNQAEKAKTGTVSTNTPNQPTLDSRGCSANSLFSSTTGQPCSVTNTLSTQISNNLVSTPINYSSFSKIQMSQYAEDPSAYLGQQVQFSGIVLQFLPKGGSGGSENYLSMEDLATSTKIMAEVYDNNMYSALVNNVQMPAAFLEIYGIGTTSQKFTNGFGTTTSVPILQLSAADACTGDDYSCTGTLQHIVP